MRRVKFQLPIMLTVLLAGLFGITPARVTLGQGVSSGKAEAAQAWEVLLDAAQKRLSAVDIEPSVVRGIIQELEEFAKRYPKAEASFSALFNAATLAARVGDYEVAERNLKAARGQTRDAELLGAIDAELARLSVRPGKPAPALAVDEWVRGKPATLDELKGKVILLDIFQIICPGCHRAHPEIVRMQERYKKDGFEVLGLAVAFELHSAQTPEKIRHYVNRKAYPYPVALDKGLIETFRRYGARGTPFTVLIDRQGRIRYLDFFRLAKVESTIRRLLDENVGK